jgi:hypothetical protein
MSDTRVEMQDADGRWVDITRDVWGIVPPNDRLASMADELFRDWMALRDSGLAFVSALRDPRLARALRRPSRGMRRHIRRLKARGEWQ